jgi:hypothetical protein
MLRSALRLPTRLSYVTREACELLRWTARVQLRTGLSRRRDARLIRHSGLFDEAFYLSQCGGDPAARRNPIRHYLDRGAALGLDPSPLFDTSAHATSLPGCNPLAHFIRSRGAGWRDPPPAALLRAPTLTGGGEPLLDRPFRPASAERSTRALIVVDRVVRPDQDPRSARTFAILELLRDMGHPVTFIAQDPAPRDDDALKELGCGLHRGFPAALAHLIEDGHLYRFVILSGAEQAFLYLPSVRAYVPHAAVIYDCALEFLAGRGQAGLSPEVAKPPHADRLRRLERANVASADVVLVASADDREILLREVPRACVEVVPRVRTLASRSVYEHLSAAEVKARLASVLAASGPRARADGEGAGSAA